MAVDKKKKVGTLTFHVAHNYGAMLQAYALPEAVKSLGYDAEVIDYRFPYIYEWGKVEKLNDLVQKHGWIGGVLRWVKRYLKGNYNPGLKINQFNYFRDSVMRHSAKAYMSKEELNNLEYDVILFGSDQIWNEQLTDGVATEFFGEFSCLDKTKKIAYAASNGQNKFPDELKDIYYPLLKLFSGLGIREEGLKDSLLQDGFKAVNVLDPTLLLSQEDWDEMIKNTPTYIRIPKEEYLLVYVFDESDYIYDWIKKLADERNLKVVVIAYSIKEIIKDFTVYTECGPAEFISLISNAKMVITTSFHGTVFSVLYHKDFYCIPHPKFHERTDSLLNILQLQDRNLSALDMIMEHEEIPWEEVDKILKDKRRESLEFLKNTIEN